MIDWVINLLTDWLTVLVCWIISVSLYVIQVIELLVSRSDEGSSAVELESAMQQLTSHAVCYVTSVSVCAAAQMSGTNAKFWTSLEQRALDILEKVFTFITPSFFLMEFLTLLFKAVF